MRPRKLALLLLSILLCAASSFSQSSVHYHDIALVNQSGLTRSLQSASISVCAYGALGVPCSPTTNVYSDIGLTQLKPQPFLADSNGNYDFWAPPGNYVVTVTYTGFAGFSTVVSLSPVNTITVSGNNAFTGNNTHTGTETFASLNDTGLTPGNCVQAGAGGLLTTVSIPCPPATSGTVTHTPGALTSNLPVIGNGGADIGVGTRTGNTTQFATWNGATTAARCIDTDASGNLQITGADCQSALAALGWINVKSSPYNCVGDGATNDATCIDAASTAAANLCASNGGNATSAPIVYFPPSTGNYVYSGTWTIPATNKCPLTFIFNNSLNVDQVVPGGYDSFIGLGGGNFNGLIGSFVFVPTVNFTQNSVNKPLLDCKPCVTNLFEGINFESSGTNTSEVVHIHDLSGSGSTEIDFKHDTINNNGSGGGILVNSSANNIVAGFGLRIRECSIFSQGTAFPVSLTNFGAVKISDSSFGGTGYGAIYVKNAGVGEANQFIFDNILDEALNAHDFLYIDSTASAVTEITLRNVDISDSFGSPTPTLINNTGGNTNQVMIEEAGDVSAATYVNLAHPVALASCIGQRCVATVKATGGYTPQMVGASSALNNGPAPFGIDSSANQYVPSISFDPGYGMGLGDSVNFGITARAQQRAPQSFDISLAQAVAPTGVSATVQSGAGLANGTYFWVVFATLNNGNCNVTSTSPSRSAASFEVTATTTPGNDQVLIAWTQATGTGIVGYCVARGTTSFGENTQYFVNGVGTTSFTDIGGAGLNAGIGYPAFNYSFPTQNYPNDTGNGQYHFGLAGLVATLPLGGTSLQVLNGGFAASITGTLTGARTQTIQDKTGTLADSGDAPIVQFCGTTTSCAHSAEVSDQIVYGSAPLVSGTPSAAAVTGLSPAFTSSTSYRCTLTAETGAATALLSVSYVSGSAFTITGPNTDTRVVDYICVGH